MAKRKKPILPPTKATFDMGLLDDLIASVEHIVDSLTPIQYTDTDMYFQLCIEPAQNDSIDYYRDLKWWLLQLRTLKWEHEVAQYLATLLPDIPELTVEDIDDSTLAELQKFTGNSIRYTEQLEQLVDLCNKYYK